MSEKPKNNKDKIIPEEKSEIPSITKNEQGELIMLLPTSLISYISQQLKSDNFIADNLTEENDRNIQSHLDHFQIPVPNWIVGIRDDFKVLHIAEPAIYTDVKKIPEFLRKISRFTSRQAGAKLVAKLSNEGNINDVPESTHVVWTLINPEYITAPDEATYSAIQKQNVYLTIQINTEKGVIRSGSFCLVFADFTYNSNQNYLPNDLN